MQHATMVTLKKRASVTETHRANAVTQRFMGVGVGGGVWVTQEGEAWTLAEEYMEIMICSI